VDYLLAGDSAAAPLIARLPACLLCRHTAAVGAELLAHRARLTEALAESVAASSTAGIWAECPEADGVTGMGGDSFEDGEDLLCSSSLQLEGEDGIDGVDHGESSVDQTDVVIAQGVAASMGEGGLAALTALGLVTRRGGGDTWTEIAALPRGGGDWAVPAGRWSSAG
jgi:hypothetical protein